jgi:hypothetical protein
MRRQLTLDLKQHRDLSNEAMISNIDEVRRRLILGQTTVREEIVVRRDEMKLLSKTRPGMRPYQVKMFNKIIDFILMEIHLIRMMEAKKL